MVEAVRRSWLISVVLVFAFAMPGMIQSVAAQTGAPATKTGGASVEIKEDGSPVKAAPEAPTAATLELLRKMEAKHGASKSVRATFNQIKVSEVFLEELHSTGQFLFRKPGFFRCDYDPPDAMTNLIAEEAIYVYVPSLKQVEVYRFASPQERDQQLHSMVLGFGFKAEELIKEYEARTSEDNAPLAEELKTGGEDSSKIVLLEVRPAAALAETSPFTKLKLWIDKESLLPRKVWFEDYNGDKTTVNISKIDFDTEMKDAEFDPKKLFPQGTEWIDKTSQQP